MLPEYNKFLHLILNSSKKHFCSYGFQHIQVGNKVWMMNAQADSGKSYQVGCPSPAAHVYRRNNDCFILLLPGRKAEGREWYCHAVVPAEEQACSSQITVRDALFSCSVQWKEGSTKQRSGLPFKCWAASCKDQQCLQLWKSQMLLIRCLLKNTVWLKTYFLQLFALLHPKEEVFYFSSEWCWCCGCRIAKYRQADVVIL